MDFPFPKIERYNISADDGENSSIDIDITSVMVSVMTQSCDITNEKVNNIMLCPVFKLQDYVDELRSSGLSDGKIKESIENMRKNSEYSKFLINYTTLYDINDYLVIDYDSVVALPIDVVKRVAMENKVMALDAPYKERMAQNYAFFYMRIGFKEDIDRDSLKERTAQLLSRHENQ